MSRCMCIIRLHRHIGVVALIGPMSANDGAAEAEPVWAVGVVEEAGIDWLEPGMTTDNGVTLEDETGVAAAVKMPIKQKQQKHLACTESDSNVTLLTLKDQHKLHFAADWSWRKCKV